MLKGDPNLAWRMVADGDGDGQKEDIRNGLEIYPEAKALIQMLKEDGQWGSDSVEDI